MIKEKICPACKKEMLPEEGKVFYKTDTIHVSCIKEFTKTQLSKEDKWELFNDVFNDKVHGPAFQDWLSDREVEQGLDDGWHDCDGPIGIDSLYDLLLDWKSEQ